MGYRRDLWEIAAHNHGVVTISEAQEVGVPGVEVRKLASRGALTGYGKGVYVHNDIPQNRFTQPALAVALAGKEAFLQYESVLDLLELGQVNPPKIAVGIPRIIRRTLPGWMEAEYRKNMRDAELALHHNIPTTSVFQTLQEMKTRMPLERWYSLVNEAERKEYITRIELENLN